MPYSGQHYPHKQTIQRVFRKIKNVSPFILETSQAKYLGINLTEYVQDLHEKNKNSLMIAIKG